MASHDREGRPFPQLKNDVILRTARLGNQEQVTPPEYTPVWIMRQAGRYLPEYHTVRERAGDFFDLCRNPELAAEVTIQPVERFPLDAAIIFSDILVVPQAMGLEVQMLAAQGPVFPSPLKGPEDLHRVKALVPLDNSEETLEKYQREEKEVVAELDYVFQAITTTRHKLDGRVPLIGFAGAPWTLMAYMIEGSGSKTFAKAKAWLFQYPEASHRLLQSLTNVIIHYLVGQVRAGAQLLQVFDSWAGELDKDTFDEFLLPYLRKIQEGVQQSLAQIPQVTETVPMIVFAKGAHYAVESLARETRYSVIGLDWLSEPDQARSACSAHRPVCLQGNLDPCVLYADTETIRKKVRLMLQKFGPGPHIANLGHGLHPSHDPARVADFVEAIHSISKELYHN